MRVLKVDLGSESYNIVIGSGLLGMAGEYISPLLKTKKVLVVSNPTIYPLYGDILNKSLTSSGFEVITYLIPDGEEYKNIEQAMNIIDYCIESKLERSSAIIALGGGVIGDLAGFVASIYQRGISYIQVPTTLLAQVDSSVGGKVAVNHPRGKNMIGSFHQPKLVVTDIDTLDTLEQRDFESGLGEVCKYGIIYNKSFFEYLEQKVNRIKNKSTEEIQYIIFKSCEIKSKIVEQDEKESGLRAILNLGHTFGHAIENLTGYGTYRHGEAVVMGTIAASRLALNLNLINNEHYARIINLYKNLGIFRPYPKILPEKVYQVMLNDKKVVQENLTFILPKDIGDYAIVDNVAKEQVLSAICDAQNEKI